MFLASAILSQPAADTITDVLKIGALVTAILLPLFKWQTSQVRRIVREENAPLKRAAEEHQKALEGISTGPLMQLLPNGGSSMRDRLADVQSILKEAS